MGKLVYAALASLDGYVEDDAGSFDWAAPDDDVHAFVNELERSIGTCLYGRRMYETMAYWQTAGIGTDGQGPAHEYAEIGRASEKIVYSRTLTAEGRIGARPVDRRCRVPEVCGALIPSRSADRGIASAQCAARAALV